MKEQGESLAELAQFRQAAYRLFAAALLYPDEERRTTLALVARILRVQSDTLAAFPFFGHWQQLLDTLQELITGEITGIEETYVHLFLLADGDGALCPPYESFFLASGEQATGHIGIAVQLTQEYAAAGLAPASGEVPDHAAVELEFMAFLCGQEVQAWKENALEHGFQAWESQCTFLSRHLGRWCPLLARRVSELAPESFYHVIVAAVDAFIHHDLDLVNLLVKEMQT
ncbi:MAG: molecular chaperone [Anaerolineae bacterium]